MSVAAAARAGAGARTQNPSTTRRPHRPICRNPIKTPPFSNLPPPPSLLSQSQHRLASLRSSSSRRRTGVIIAGEGATGSLRSAGADQLSLDALLSVAEVLCIAPPAIYSIGCLVGSLLPGGSKLLQVQLGSRVFALQFFLLAGAVAIGGLIRRRQWLRICTANASRSGVDLVARIEKVEEDLRSSASIVRVLSRQLEKLGIRFRVTRKTLKEPIAETAALAQKNSEATRALAMHEDILEKELGEIQKVLLAMQEQQKKQLELILAIGKAGGLLESRRDAVSEQVPMGTREKEEVKPLEIQTGRHAGANNDRF